MNETLRAYTERALQATYDGAMIPPIVYLPAKLRKGKQRLAQPGFVTTNPKTPDEIEEQIAAADPAGLLIALMQGQPIPAFEISDPDPTGHVTIETRYVTADLELRANIAMRLTARTRVRKRVEDAGYAARVAEAAAAFDEEQDGL